MNTEKINNEQNTEVTNQNENLVSKMMSEMTPFLSALTQEIKNLSKTQSEIQNKINLNDQKNTQFNDQLTKTSETINNLKQTQLNFMNNHDPINTKPPHSQVYMDLYNGIAQGNHDMACIYEHALKLTKTGMLSQSRNINKIPGYKHRNIMQTNDYQPSALFNELHTFK